MTAVNHHYIHPRKIQEDIDNQHIHGQVEVEGVERFPGDGIMSCAVYCGFPD